MAGTAKRSSVLLAALTLLGMGVAVPAQAGTTFQALLSPDGSGHLFVNDGSTPEWKACRPDLSSCTPFITGGDISTNGAPAGTVFWAGEDSLSPVWHGNLTFVTPPSIVGALRANELVTPVPGGWHGGWEGESSSMQLSVCDTPTGVGCLTLTHSHFVGECPETATVLDPAFTGKFLRVADRRSGAGPHFEAAYAVPSPYGDEIWLSSPTTSVAVVGRIASAIGPRTEKCGPPPLVEASISKRGIATVRCQRDCRAVLIAKRRPHRARLVRNLMPSSRLGSREESGESLQLPRRALRLLGQGRIRMVVKVDGKLYARRTVLIGIPRQKEDAS